MTRKSARGSNPNSHGNNPDRGWIARLIKLPIAHWNAAKTIGNDNYSAGVRVMAGVALGQKGILWAVPLSPIALPRRFDRVPHEHITLWYGCDRADVPKHIGVIFTAPVISIANDDRVEAARVVLPTGIPFKQTVPHITLSLSEDASPIESTAMLQEVEGKTVEFVASFAIEFFEFPV